MRYLTVKEVLEIYARVMEQSGGAIAVRDLGALESAVAQPRMTFAGEELYPTLIEKASALGFSLIQNHPFVDGNKRTGHAAVEVFLLLNGQEMDAGVDEQVNAILRVASGEMEREVFTEWLKMHTALRG
jgi:death on curing protein